MTEDSTAAIESHLFKFLDERGRALLMQHGTEVVFTANKVVVREGDLGDALYLVKAGKVRVQTVRDGKEFHLAHLSEGACFGEVAVLSGQPRTATVVAVEDCTFLRFSRRHIEEVLDHYPKVRKLLETMVLGRAEDTIKKVLAASGPKAAESEAEDE